MSNSRNTLKSYFQTGDRPTEQQFAELIDKAVNVEDDKASVAEANAGNNDIKYMTAAKVKTSIDNNVPLATTTVQGKIEIATLTEVETGTDSTRAVTPAGAKRSVETFAPVKSVNGQTGIVNLVIPTQQDSGWQTPTLLNGFTNFNVASGTYQIARYRKINNVVYIEGFIKGGTNNQTIFTLPVGFRPSKRLVFSVLINNNTIGRIDIEANGNVIGVLTNTTWSSLSGISFLVG